MGYRGKLQEREEARRLRARNKTLQQIADELGVSKSSVSIWVRDVPFTPSKRRYGARGPRRNRHFFEIDEARVRVRVYLHQGLDLDAAEEHWSRVTGVP